MTVSTIITASAGSGKTFTVSSELLKLILSNQVDLSSILVTTFTKKAASEIFTRLISRLLKANTNQGLIELKEQINLPDLTLDQVNAGIFKLVRFQNKIKIQTIDSFFLSLGQAFQSELELPLEWSITDDWEDEELNLEVLNNTFKSIGLEKLNLILALVYREQESSRIFLSLIKEINDLNKELFLSSIDSWVVSLNVQDTFTSNLNLTTLAETVKQLAEAKTLNDSRVVKGLLGLIDSFDDKDWDGTLSGKLSFSIFNEKYTYYNKAIPSELQKPFLGLIQATLKQTSQDIINQSMGLAAMFMEFTRNRKQLIKEKSLMSFQDLSFLLAENLSKDHLSEIYYRLDSKFSYLFIDEFQDTSAIQWMILNPLATDIANDNSGRKALFAVGDSKQAIYGWRGGLRNIFSHTKSQLPHLKTLPLFESYRSSKTIIEFVNKIFTEPTLPKEYSDIQVDWSTNYHEHRSKVLNNNGFVEIINVKLNADKLESSNERLNNLKTIIASNLSSYPDDTIGILTRSNSQAKTIEKFLLKEGFSVSSVTKETLGSNYYTQIIISLLTLAEHPLDKLSYFHILGNPFLKKHFNGVGIQELSFNLKQSIHQNGLSNFVREIIKIISSDTNSGNENIFKSISNIATGLERQKGLDLNYLIKKLNGFSLNSEDQSRISILTIHKSKGLEFDHVILPYTEDSFFNDKNITVLKEQNDPFSPPTSIVKNPKKETRRYFLELEKLANEARKARIAEALCLSYVAVTRAKSRLSILIGAKKTELPESEVSLRSLLVRSLGLELTDSSQEIFFLGSRSMEKPLAPAQEKTTPQKTVDSLPIIPEVPLERASKGLPIVSPSQMHWAGRKSLRDIFSKPNEELVTLGSEIHQVLEKLAKIYSTQDDLQNDFELRASEMNIGKESLIKLNQFLKSPCSDEIFIGDGKGHKKVYTEFEINCLLNDSIVKGRIDRLILDLDEAENLKSITFYDFKLNDIQNSIKQISIYQEVLEQYFKLEKKLITGYLVSIEGLTSTKATGTPTTQILL